MFSFLRCLFRATGVNVVNFLDISTEDNVHQLDMARYRVENGPKCFTCVPVLLCFFIFFGKKESLLIIIAWPGKLHLK